MAGLLPLVGLSRRIGRLIEAQTFELERPFGRRIAQAGNADTPRQTTFDSGVHEGGSDESHRDREIDVTDAAFVARSNLLNPLGLTGDDLVQPLSAPRNRFDQAVLRSGLMGRTSRRETVAGNRISRNFRDGGLHHGISSRELYCPSLCPVGSRPGRIGFSAVISNRRLEPYR